MDHTKLVLELENELLRSKYSKLIFYCHNLGVYDIVFILKILYLFNEDTTEEKYKISLTLKDNKILKCVISRNKQSLVLIDSYPVLPQNFLILAEYFNVVTMKTLFPYKESLQYPLFYFIGALLLLYCIIITFLRRCIRTSLITTGILNRKLLHTLKMIYLVFTKLW